MFLKVTRVVGSLMINGIQSCLSYFFISMTLVLVYSHKNRFLEEGEEKIGNSISRNSIRVLTQMEIDLLLYRVNTATFCLDHAYVWLAQAHLIYFRAFPVAYEALVSIYILALNGPQRI